MVFPRQAISKRLLKDAVRFHGHLGPFLVLGLRAGLVANEVLGRTLSETYVIVETEPFPPFSCIVDGIQIATGCTMGKGKIELRKGSSVSITFLQKERRLRIFLKNGVLETLKGVSSMEEGKQMALTFVEKPVQELFEIEL